MCDLLQSIARKLSEDGWSLRTSGQTLEAQKEAIVSSWLLGSCRVVHALRLELDAASKVISLRETATEKNRGLPPPCLRSKRFKQHGLTVSETRVDDSFSSGGGTLAYGAPREWIEQECSDAGWAFKLRIL